MRVISHHESRGRCWSSRLKARLSAKDLRRMDRVIQFGMISGIEAFEDSGLDLSDEERELSGVLIGAGIGGIETIENTTRTMASGQKKVSPFYIPSSIINMISGDLSIELGLRGPNLAITTACSTGTHCIGIAARLIATGDATVMIAGGSRSVDYAEYRCRIYRCPGIK